MKILIVEDEAAIAKSIESKCEQILEEKVESIKIIYSLHRANEYIQENEIDLCILDLNLNGLSGFDLLKTAVAYNFHTIVISANTDQAITAFEYGILDFIPKPFDVNRLRKAFQKVELHQNVMKNTTRFISIKKNGRIEAIELTKIRYFEAEGMYINVILENGSIELLNKSMERLHQLLPDHFYRCHRSYIIDLNKMDSFYHASGGTYKLKLKSGEEISLSRDKYKELCNRFNYS